MTALTTETIIKRVRLTLRTVDTNPDTAVDNAAIAVIHRTLSTHHATEAMDCDHNDGISRAAARNIAYVGRAEDAAHRARNPHRPGAVVTAEDIATAGASELLYAITRPSTYGERIAGLYRITCEECDADVADAMSEIFYDSESGR